MAVSLGFHIVFAAIGMAMPFLMTVAHGLWLKTKDVHYLHLTKAWSKGVAIFFAIGAVSGTALAFELGLLWPEFMKHAGPIVGMPFSWEGTAFFIEAIALGLYLYGWDRLPARVHWFTGAVVGCAGVASAFFVTCANAWMNSPAGFDWIDGKAANIDPVAAMFNARSLDMGLHMIIAAFVATGFAVAGVHAWQLLRFPGHPLHKRALPIALAIASGAAILAPISGDITAKMTAKHQPVKFAAMEAHFETTTRAPLMLGGIPDVDAGEVSWAIHVPMLLSFLAFGDIDAEVKGLNDFPRELWPPVTITHFAYQTMIGIGTLLALSGSLALFLRWRRRDLLESPRILRLWVLLTPLGFVALECGWMVTEVGRQPWIVYGVMKTRDAVTPMPGLVWSLAFYCILYFGMAVLAAWLLRRQIATVGSAASLERGAP